MDRGHTSFFRLPVRYYVLAAGAFFAALMGWTRFVLAILNRDVYQVLGVLPGVWYLVVTGLLAGLVYTLAGILALVPVEKNRRITQFLLCTGLILFWVDRIFFARSQIAQSSLPFSLAFSFVITALAAGMLIGKFPGER